VTRVRVTPCVSAYGYARVRVRVWISVPEAKPHPYPRCYGFSRSVPDVRSSGHVPTLLININNSRTFSSHHHHHHHHHPLPRPSLGDNHHLWATTTTSGQRQRPRGDYHHLWATTTTSRRQPPHTPLPRFKSETDSLATAAASPPPPPLARKRELGVFLGFVSS
jgi:hypothetical protein